MSVTELIRELLRHTKQREGRSGGKGEERKKTVRGADEWTTK